MRLYRALSSVLLLACFQGIVFAQSHETTKQEKLITINFVHLYDLYKIEEDGAELYALSIPNKSKHYEPVVLHLGTYREMISNLQNLSTAIGAGKEGDIFDFQSDGYQYKFAHHSAIGQPCLKVYKEPIGNRNYGILYKYTLDKILEYFAEK